MELGFFSLCAVIFVLQQPWSSQDMGNMNFVGRSDTFQAHRTEEGGFCLTLSPSSVFTGCSNKEYYRLSCVTSDLFTSQDLFSLLLLFSEAYH